MCGHSSPRVQFSSVVEGGTSSRWKPSFGVAAPGRGRVRTPPRAALAPGPWPADPFTWRFVAAWCGVSETTAGQATRELLALDVIRTVGEHPGRPRPTGLFEGHEPALAGEPAHHYRGNTDLSAVTPTIDWAGGGLVTTAPDLARFV